MRWVSFHLDGRFVQGPANDKTRKHLVIMTRWLALGSRSFAVQPSHRHEILGWVTNPILVNMDGTTL